MPSLISAGAYLTVLLALAARLIRLRDNPVWWDEGWSVWLARQDLLSIARITASDEHPPLHYWLLHYWTSMAGEDPFAVRFSSVAIGVLTVALLYRLGSDLVSPQAGLVAALLLTASRFHIWWSQEIKMYSITVFLALLSAVLFVRLLRSGGRHSFSYLMATFACVMTSYLGVLVLVAQNAFLMAALVVRPTDWQIPWRRWIALQAGVVGLSVPWAAYYLVHASAFERIGSFEPTQALLLYLTVLPLGISTNIDEYLPVALVYSGVALAGFASVVRAWWRPAPGTERRALEAWLLPLICVLVVPLGLLAFSLPLQAPYQPKVSERYMIVFLPMYLLLLAYGLLWLWGLRRPLALTAAVACGVVSGVSLSQYFADRQPDHDTPALAYALQHLYQPGDAIVLNPDSEWPRWAYYVPVAEANWLRVPHGARMDAQEAAHWLSPMAQRADTVWLVTDTRAAVTDPRREVPRWLAGHYHQVGSRVFLRSRLTLYSRDDSRDLERVVRPLTGDQQPLGLPGISLRQVGPLPSRIRAGQVAYLFTTWSAATPTTRGYRARVLLQQDGASAATSRDWSALLEDGGKGQWQPGETMLARHALAIPRSSDGGAYSVALEVDDGGKQRTTVRLGTVTVDPVRSDAAGASELTPSPAVLDGVIELGGYRLSSTVVHPGDRLLVDLRWQAQGDVGKNASVFVHFSSADDAVWASGDGVPGDGSLPTSVWSGGDVIDDRHALTIPAIAPPGVYTIYVGMYDPLTGQRLSATTPGGQALSENRIPLATVTVLPQ